MKNILVTGGNGFIGSHTCISLLENNYKLTIIDSNINSSQIVIERLKIILKNKFSNLDDLLISKKGDIRDRDFLNQVFMKASKDKNPIEAVIHFAGLKSVGESVINPFRYWDNNVFGSLNLFRVMQDYDCKIIVFSSSATVYGKPDSIPIYEDFVLKPNNPYGNTKASIEKMLGDIYISSKNSWRIANLRYFNPIGAHSSGLIGEDPNDKPNNLFPLICRVAQGKYKFLNVYGKDWETPDGTGIRDYIHVMDLAEAHTSAIKYLFKNSPQLVNLNIGTGVGTSVLELIEKFSLINNCNVPYIFCKRRKGDVPILIAKNSKAISLLDWKPKRNIEDMCKDGWNWQKNNPFGYDLKKKIG
tara:strand:- start:116 stop:1189 length:1074 start_codon:yes stop_codon:yes gene_type:complete